MAEVESAVSIESVPGVPDPIQQLPSDVMQVSDKMILLTWLVFGIAALCLHKLLWKPILRAVEGREQSISEALDGAERARKELSESESRGRQVIDQASEEARAMADQAARDAAAMSARADKAAQAVAQRRLEDAEREIGVAQRKAVEAVRLDVATQLGDTLERLLRRNITEEQKRAYQEEMLSEVRV